MLGAKGQGPLLQGRESQAQGLSRLGGVGEGWAPVPTAAWSVTRAHVCQPKAKLSAQLSDTVWGGEWGRPEKT